MPKQFERESNKRNPRHNQRLRTYKDTSFVSNNDSNNINLNIDPQTIDFEEYLYTEHFSPSQEHCESVEYHENDFSQEIQSLSEKNQDGSENIIENHKIFIEMGENYTFADQISSHRKENRQNQVDLKLFPQLNKKLINLFPLSQSYKNLKQPELNFSSASSVLIPSHSEIYSSTSSKEISLSDNEEDQGVVIYKTKEIQQQMFLKISLQTKEILKLQQKLYYYEDLSKRLLKSEQQSSEVKRNLATEIKNLKKKSKAKTNTIQGLQQKLLQKQKEIEQLKSANDEILNQYRSNQKANSLTKRQAERKSLLQKQNLQNITLLENRNKLITEKYQILLEKYQKIETKSFDLVRQLEKNKKDNQVLKKKNLNIQNMNKILQKQISELNVKVFQMQNDMEKLTCDKYASNLIRIKNFNFQAGTKETISKKNSPLITQAFETSCPFDIKKS